MFDTTSFEAAKIEELPGSGLGRVSSVTDIAGGDSGDTLVFQELETAQGTRLCALMAMLWYSAHMDVSKVFSGMIGPGPLGTLYLAVGSEQSQV
jgi:hypothetical protein